VVEQKKYAAYMDTPPVDINDESLASYWATRCMLQALQPILELRGPLFVGLAGRSLGLAMVSRRVLPGDPSPITIKVNLPPPTPSTIPLAAPRAPQHGAWTLPASTMVKYAQGFSFYNLSSIPQVRALSLFKPSALYRFFSASGHQESGTVQYVFWEAS